MYRCDHLVSKKTDDKLLWYVRETFAVLAICMNGVGTHLFIHIGACLVPKVVACEIVFLSLTIKAPRNGSCSRIPKNEIYTKTVFKALAKQASISAPTPPVFFSPIRWSFVSKHHDELAGIDMSEARDPILQIKLSRIVIHVAELNDECFRPVFRRMCTRYYAERKYKAPLIILSDLHRLSYVYIHLPRSTESQHLRNC